MAAESRIFVAVLLAVAATAALACGQPSTLAVRYHLTARPWAPSSTTPADYLDVIDGLVRFSIRLQDADGAIIDPFLHKEHQYATPYFAYAVGTLVKTGRSRELLPHGVKAMEHATRLFAGGRDVIPEQHGEFFIPCLTEALAIYKPLVSAEQFNTWRERMRKPLIEVIKGSVNNWQTYAMKGQWLRQEAGLVSRDEAIAFIEDCWMARQRAHIAEAPFLLYHDRTSDPDTLSVEAVGRGNLLALTHFGYDGPSAAEIAKIAEAATRVTLMLQDPTGQAPANGRTDDHVWVDVGYQLAFEVMAERSLAAGDLETAGRFRRAASLALQNIQRWRRDDGMWKGSFYVTKNHFDPELRVGYQDASQYTNYNGSLMFHLAEAFGIHRSAIQELPAPSEIGGYAFELDREYASAFANAGGLQIQVNLRGQVGASSGNYWTPLGLVRVSRAGWDSRLGPSDGALTAQGGVSFAPEFLENGRWLRMASLPARYEARWSASFVHPSLVRCAVEYRPREGHSGPSFRDDLVVTPDGILSTVTKTSGDAVKWGVTLPLLENDGRPLRRTGSETSSSAGGDTQSFVTLKSGARIDDSAPAMRSTYGDLRPVRATDIGLAVRTFIYPHNGNQPAAAAVRDTFVVTDNGFRSLLGSVDGNVYVGRTVAGGRGKSVKVGSDTVNFSEPCGFVLQVKGGRVLAVETDHPVHVELHGKRLQLAPFIPTALEFTINSR